MPVLNDALDIRLGANPVSEVYLGAVKVWPTAVAPPAAALTPVFRTARDKLFRGQAIKPMRGVDIGPESPTRTVIALVTFWSGGSRTLNGVTIGGVDATSTPIADLPLGGVRSTSAWWAVVPTGTTTDIIATMSDGTPEVSIAVWTVDALIEVVSAKFTDTVAGNPVDTVVLPATAPGGFALAGYSSRSTALTTVWTGITERYDTGTPQPVSGGDGPTDGNPLTITATFDPVETQVTRVGAVAFGRAP